MMEENVTKDLKGLEKATVKLWDYLKSDELWDFILVATIKIIAIMILSYIVIFVGKRIITRIFKLRMKAPINQSERRTKTIVRLLHSTLTYTVYFSAIIAILSALNIQVMGLLAGAGIAGLAIGFGAQSLVKDIITGFFIILEDQFGVGDYIRISQAEGTVTEIGLRTTKIIASTGEKHIIPNGMISDVINYSVNNSKALIDIDLGINADIDKVEQLIKNYLEDLPNKHEELVSVPTYSGVQKLTGTDMTVRIIAETKPMQHGKIASVIRKDVRNILKKNGIPMAYSKMVLFDQSSNSK